MYCRPTGTYRGQARHPDTDVETTNESLAVCADG